MKHKRTTWLPIGTIWRHSLKRVARRSAAYLAAPSFDGLLQLTQATRLANDLAR